MWSSVGLTQFHIAPAAQGSELVSWAKEQFGGVSSFTTLQDPVNITFTGIKGTRSHLRKILTFLLIFTFIHAPQTNRSGRCLWIKAKKCDGMVNTWREFSLLLSQELRLHPSASWGGNYRRWRSHWRFKLMRVQLNLAWSSLQMSFTSSTSRITSASGDQPQEFISHLTTAGIQCRFITTDLLNTLMLTHHRNVSVDVVPSDVKLVLRGPAGTFWKINAQKVYVMVSEEHEVPQCHSAH